MAVGELVEAGGRSRAEEWAWGTAGDKCRKKSGTRRATDIYMTVNQKSRWGPFLSTIAVWRIAPSEIPVVHTTAAFYSKSSLDSWHE